MNYKLIMMKTKYLLLALAAPLVITACTNDEFETNTVNANLGELIPTAGISFNAGFADVQTRMGFNGEKFTWTLDYNDAETDRLGLCYVINGQTYTNYEFKVNVLQAESGNKYAVAANGSAFNPAAVKAGDTDVSIASNIARAPYASFVTENATIYGGSYVAYYPYNTELHDVTANIPVSVAAIQTATADENYVGDYAFYISKPFEIVGGQTEANFSMQQVLPILRFDMKNVGKKSLTVSSISVTAADGMPVAASIPANLTSDITVADVKVDAAKNADKLLLTLPASSTINVGQTNNTLSAYMVVMPGTYKNMTIRVRLSDGSYQERTIESVNLGLNALQPVNLELDSEGMTIGDVYSDITSAEALKAALEAAATKANGQIDIDIIRPFEAESFADIYPAITNDMAGAKVIVKGEKITITGETDTYSSVKALKNVTFENDVEFKGAYNTCEGDDITFAGTTTFGSTVTVVSSSALSIAGTATATGNVTIGDSQTSKTAAALNILEDGTLNAGGNVKTADASYAHALNVEGTLNLNGNALTQATSELELAHTQSVITIPGTLNVSALGKVTIAKGTWNVGNGAIVNNGEIVVSAESFNITKTAAQSAMTLTNNGKLSTTFSNYRWSGQNVAITNNGTYTLTGCTGDNLTTIVTNENGVYSNVNGIEASLADDYALTEDVVDMSAYTVTFTLDASSATNTKNITIPATETWSVGTLNVKMTGATSTNTATLNIKPADTEAVESVGVAIDEMSVEGTANNYNSCEVKFAKNTEALVSGTIGALSVKDAKVTSETDNNVTCQTTPVTSGTTSISLQ